MITDILFSILGLFSKVLLGIFTPISAVFNFIIPAEIFDSANTLGMYLIYVKGIFPIDTLLDVIAMYVLFIVSWYSLKLMIALWAFLPFVGRNFVFPTIRKKIPGAKNK